MDKARELLQSGRLAELEWLMAQSPPAEGLHIAAALHLAHNQPEQALQAVRQSLQLQSTFSQRNTLAVCLLRCGRAHEAIEVLQALLHDQPDNPDLWFNLARARGRGIEGWQAAVQALRCRPGWRQAELLQAALAADLGHLDEALSLVRRDLAQPAWRLLEAQLVFRQGRYGAAAQLCLAYLQEQSQCREGRCLLVQALIEAGEIPNHPRLAHELELSLGLPGAYHLVPAALRLWPERESLLLALLHHDLVCDLELERQLTEWRRSFRFHPQPCPRAEALAVHNFTNEFCFAESPEETDNLQPDHPAYPLYRPLPSGQPAAAPVLERHQQEPAREQELQALLTPLAPADKVARQYLQHPYPRWRSLDRAGPPRPLQQVLSGLFPHLSPGPVALDPPKILVAGCGTGRHALYCAQRFSQSQVWGIDLSPTSLAYAWRQAERLGVSGVHFVQADLLHLNQAPLPDCFELIESIGVLHHLEHPAAGLLALRQRLRPGGWMRLGLYSRRARHGLEPARRLARQHRGLGLRDLRTLLMRELAPEDLNFLASLKDFYSLSGLRDLLLHEREVEYDLPQISQLLSQAGLEFVGFDSLPESTLARFRSSYGAHNLDSLECWQRLEEQHPRTFLGMYIFWCRPCEAA
jgi:SAM-dependent methyltransferase